MNTTQSVDSADDSADARQTILALEKERGEALVAGDITRLSDMVSDDLVHVHASGRVEDKAAYLEGLRSRFRFLSVRRPRLDLRVFGDTAIMTGPLEQLLTIVATGQELAMNAYATQVWVRRDQGWQVASFQATNMPPAV